MQSNKQKMLNSELYNPLCSLLSNERKRAKALCYEYNQCHPDQKGKRQQTLSKLFNRSSKAVIEANFYCDYGYNISIGSNFYTNHNCIMLDAAPINIADNVMIGPNVTLSTTTHPLSSELRAQGYAIALPISLDDNVWIGMGAQILPGVSIGKNSIVAAGAVVTKDVPDNCMVAGIPARIVQAVS
ncbi:MAG: maltose O-acetyltransferase [Oceanospirillaceae bacterium]|jgi:maltose O-acetyltransferase